ncbi:MAG: DsbA family protein [Dehalococcoidia bacterium]|nr:DsbA family protein [Dehalococcoidia bacterium]
MGRNRRQQRLRDRKSRSSEGGSPAGTPRPSAGGGGSLSRPRKPAWRETLDSWGGFTVVGAIAAAVVIGALLVFLNRPGASENTDAYVARDHGGAAQSGRVLGAPSAPVRLIMFSDFQCPHCRTFWSETEEGLVEEFVATGQASLEYRDYAFLGPESTSAAAAASCAADQDRFWDYHDLLFLRQGRQNSGVYSDGNLKRYGRTIAEEFQDFDYDAWEDCYDTGTHVAAVQVSTQAAAQQGIASTPTVLVNGTRVEGARDLATYRQAIEAALAAGG